jgi:integrase
MRFAGEPEDRQQRRCGARDRRVRRGRVEEVDRLPCRTKLVRRQTPEIEFHEPEEYEQLLEGTRKAGERTHILTLLGGDAGLRIGEIIALEWSDLDLRHRLLKVQRSEWQGSWGARTSPPPCARYPLALPQG